MTTQVFREQRVTRVIRGAGATRVVRPPVTRVVQGQRGPAGPAGASSGAVVHNQTAPSVEWIVNHNLGYRPMFTLMDAAGNEFDAHVLHVSNNQLRVYLASPQTGSVRCL